MTRTESQPKSAGTDTQYELTGTETQPESAGTETQPNSAETETQQQDQPRLDNSELPSQISGHRSSTIHAQTQIQPQSDSSTHSDYQLFGAGSFIKLVPQTLGHTQTQPGTQSSFNTEQSASNTQPSTSKSLTHSQTCTEPSSLSTRTALQTVRHALEPQAESHAFDFTFSCQTVSLMPPPLPTVIPYDRLSPEVKFLMSDPEFVANHLFFVKIGLRPSYLTDPYTVWYAFFPDKMCYGKTWSSAQTSTQPDSGYNEYFDTYYYYHSTEQNAEVPNASSYTEHPTTGHYHGSAKQPTAGYFPGGYVDPTTYYYGMGTPTSQSSAKNYSGFPSTAYFESTSQNYGGFSSRDNSQSTSQNCRGFPSAAYSQSNVDSNYGGFPSMTSSQSNYGGFPSTAYSQSTSQSYGGFPSRDSSQPNAHSNYGGFPSTTSSQSTSQNYGGFPSTAYSQSNVDSNYSGFPSTASSQSTSQNYGGFPRRDSFKSTSQNYGGFPSTASSQTNANSFESTQPSTDSHSTAHSYGYASAGHSYHYWSATLNTEQTGYYTTTDPASDYHSLAKQPKPAPTTDFYGHTTAGPNTHWSVPTTEHFPSAYVDPYLYMSTPTIQSTPQNYGGFPSTTSAHSFESTRLSTDSQSTSHNYMYGDYSGVGGQKNTKSSAHYDYFAHPQSSTHDNGTFQTKFQPSTGAHSTASKPSPHDYCSEKHVGQSTGAYASFTTDQQNSQNFSAQTKVGPNYGAYMYSGTTHTSNGTHTMGDGVYADRPRAFPTSCTPSGWPTTASAGASRASTAQPNNIKRTHSSSKCPGGAESSTGAPSEQRHTKTRNCASSQKLDTEAHPTQTKVGPSFLGSQTKVGPSCGASRYSATTSGTHSSQAKARPSFLSSQTKIGPSCGASTYSGTGQENLGTHGSQAKARPSFLSSQTKVGTSYGASMYSGTAPATHSSQKKVGPSFLSSQTKVGPSCGASYSGTGQATTGTHNSQAKVGPSFLSSQAKVGPSCGASMYSGTGQGIHSSQTTAWPSCGVYMYSGTTHTRNGTHTVGDATTTATTSAPYAPFEGNSIWSTVGDATTTATTSAPYAPFEGNSIWSTVGDATTTATTSAPYASFGETSIWSMNSDTVWKLRDTCYYP